MPAVPDEVRARWRAEAAAAVPGELHGKLRARDPQMAERLAPGDTQRIVRALEVLETSGLSLLEWQQSPREPVLREADTIRLVVSPAREELYRRIERRFETVDRPAMGLAVNRFELLPFGRRHFAGERGADEGRRRKDV